MVQMTLPESAIDETNTHEVIFAQGKRFQIKKGETVSVPPYIKDLYEESAKLRKDCARQTKQDKKMCELDLAKEVE